MDGILVVNKESNCTSRDVVNTLCEHFNTKKIGHTGTLDPIATGVLVVCINSCTKLVELLTSTYKEYEAELIFGIKTDTYDITGKILEEKDSIIDEKNIIDALNKMKGKYIQEVPIYSAVKVNGKKLYEYARNNINIELPKREVDIKELELLSIRYENNKTIIKIKTLVSKGTYIRSLINDIAHHLNTIACMSKLNRTKQGNFDIKDSYTLEDILNNNYKIISKEEVLKDYKTIDIDDNLYKIISNGCIIDNKYDSDIVVFKYNNKVISIYKEYDKDKTKLKPYKMF